MWHEVMSFKLLKTATTAYERMSVLSWSSNNKKGKKYSDCT